MVSVSRQSRRERAICLEVGPTWSTPTYRNITPQLTDFYASVVGRYLGRAALLTFGPITIMTTNNRHGLEIFCTTNDPGMLIRSCADCGNYTTWYCDKCTAKDRYPNEEWVDGQATPFCKPCEEKNPKQPYCHFCRKRMWVTPPPPPVKPSIK